MTGFPISPDSPVAHGGPLPGQADVVVIGGGIIGVMTAWELARSGIAVVLLEKGRIAGEQSSRNWGWIRAQGRDPAEIPIAVEAGAMWRQMAEEIGEDIGLRQTGVTYLARKPSEVAQYAAWLPHARAHGLDSQLLTRAATADMFPGATRQWAGALWTPGDMRAEPWLAVPALARAAARDGVTIVENCAARLLDVAAGRVAGVVTEAGRIAAPAVVVAGGAWSSLLLRRHGVDIPQLSVRASVMATGPLPLIHDGGAADPEFAFRRRVDGGYTLAPSEFHDLFVGPDAFRSFGAFWQQLRANPLGTRLLPAAPKGYPDAWGTQRHWSGDQISPFEDMRVLNPTPNRRRLARVVREFETTFPSLGKVDIKTARAGMIDVMPDVVPVVDSAPDLPGLTIATGMSGHGFGIGPAFGRITARLVRGDAPGHDISRFRLARFSDGSRIELGASL